MKNGIFNFEGNDLRTVLINKETFFVGRDIAKIIGYSDPKKAVRVHVDSEDKGIARMATPGGCQDVVCVSESGLYSLVMRSRKPQAKKFKRWVTSEVLPSIRKNGMYAKEELLEDPDMLFEVVSKLREERKARVEIENKLIEVEPKVIFSDAVASSKTSILVGELAKLIAQNGVDIGQNRLYEWLRDNKYVISRKGESYNLPVQTSIDRGLMEIKESTIMYDNCQVSLTRTTKITAKGQIYFINKFLGKV